MNFRQWLRFFTATLELTSAVLLLRSRKVAFRAIVLTVICVGAFIAQLTALHRDVLHTIILVVIAIIAWVHRAQLIGINR